MQICSECTADLIHVDQMVAKVRNIFENHVPEETDDDDGATDYKFTNSYVFKCTECSFDTIILKVFKDHMFENHDELVDKPYICSTCHRGFARHKHYENHKRLKHTMQHITVKVDPGDLFTPDSSSISNLNEKEFDELICTHCGYRSTKLKIFRNHMVRILKKGKICNCPTCQKSYQRLDHYTQHLKRLHRYVRHVSLSSKVSGHSFSSNKSLQLHGIKYNARKKISAIKRSKFKNLDVTSTPVANEYTTTKIADVVRQSIMKKRLDDQKEELATELPLKKQCLMEEEIPNDNVKYNNVPIDTIASYVKSSKAEKTPKSNAVQQTSTLLFKKYRLFEDDIPKASIRNVNVVDTQMADIPLSPEYKLTQPAETNTEQTKEQEAELPAATTTSKEALLFEEEASTENTNGIEAANGPQTATPLSPPETILTKQPGENGTELDDNQAIPPPSPRTKNNSSIETATPAKKKKKHKKHNASVNDVYELSEREDPGSDGCFSCEFCKKKVVSYKKLQRHFYKMHNIES